MMTWLTTLRSPQVNALIKHICHLERVSTWVFYVVVAAIFGFAWFMLGSFTLACAALGVFACFSVPWLGLALFIDGGEMHTKIRNHKALGVTPKTLTAMFFRYGVGSILPVVGLMIVWLALGYRNLTEKIRAKEVTFISENSFSLKIAGENLTFSWPGEFLWQRFADDHVPVTAISITAACAVVYLLVVAMAAYPAGATQSMLFHSLAGAPPMVRPVLVTASWIGLFILTVLGLFPVTTWLCYRMATRYNQDMGFKYAG